MTINNTINKGSGNKNSEYLLIIIAMLSTLMMALFFIIYNLNEYVDRRFEKSEKRIEQKIQNIEAGILNALQREVGMLNSVQRDSNINKKTNRNNTSNIGNAKKVIQFFNNTNEIIRIYLKIKNDKKPFKILAAGENFSTPATTRHRWIIEDKDYNKIGQYHARGDDNKIEIYNDKIVDKTMSTKCNSTNITPPSLYNEHAVKAINFGSNEAYKTSNGITFKPDNTRIGRRSVGTDNNIYNTIDDKIFQSGKWAKNGLKYNFNLENGKYLVKMYFAEYIFSRTGKRVFDIFLENNKVKPNMDIYNESGCTGDTAIIKEFLVDIKDGDIDIELKTISDSPFINALSIHKIIN